MELSETYINIHTYLPPSPPYFEKIWTNKCINDSEWGILCFKFYVIHIHCITCI